MYIICLAMRRDDVRLASYDLQKGPISINRNSMQQQQQQHSHGFLCIAVAWQNMPISAACRSASVPHVTRRSGYSSACPCTHARSNCTIFSDGRHCMFSMLQTHFKLESQPQLRLKTVQSVDRTYKKLDEA